MTSAFQPIIDRRSAQRAREARQDRRLEIGRVVSIDRSVFPFTARVQMTGIEGTYIIPDCVALTPLRDGTFIGADVQPAGDAHELRAGQTVLLLTAGHLDDQTWIIGEILNPTNDGAPQPNAAGPKQFEAPMLLASDTFEDDGQLYQRVHNVNGQLGVKLNSDIAPIRFYYHD